MTKIFSSYGFWVLFFAEILTSIWTAGGGPIDYHLPYPTFYSYVGEHLFVWEVFMAVAHFLLSAIKKSPFIVQFTSSKSALTCYILTGLALELITSYYLWHDQAISPKGVRIWVNPTAPGHVLRSFLIERVTTWAVVSCALLLIVRWVFGRKALLNQAAPD